jgi:hypothetical protein
MYNSEGSGVHVTGVLRTMAASQMAPYSLHSEIVLTRAHRVVVKVVHYIWNRVPFKKQTRSGKVSKHFLRRNYSVGGSALSSSIAVIMHNYIIYICYRGPLC